MPRATMAQTADGSFGSDRLRLARGCPESRGGRVGMQLQYTFGRNGVILTVKEVDGKLTGTAVLPIEGLSNSRMSNSIIRRSVFE